jgi:cytochrome oxidase Cu insertion factor (SCO1/SenC/PrrC family)
VATETDLGGVPFRLVTIVLDPDSPPADVAAVAAQAAAGTPEWTWLTGSASQVENTVALGFRRSADPVDFAPSYAIVDGWGTVRGEYRYQTLASDADKLVRHIGVLGSEIRHASGIAGFAYEAAHAFQCYP